MNLDNATHRRIMPDVPHARRRSRKAVAFWVHALASRARQQFDRDLGRAG